MIDRIVSFFGIGSGSAAHFPRQVQFVSEKTGWRGFVDQYLAPQRALGIKRFLLWMPFGQDTIVDHRLLGKDRPSRVRFDQFLQAKRAGMTWLTECFGGAIRPLVAEGCQVIAYTGTFADALEWSRMNWLDRAEYVHGSLLPFLEAGCDVAIDTSVAFPDWHPLVEVAEWLRARGVKVYCESMPVSRNPYWGTCGVTATESMYLAARNDPAFVAPPKIAGEIVRGFWGPPPAPWNADGKLDWAGWYKAKVPQALKDDGGKHSVCLQLRAYLNQGGKIEELI